MGFWDVSVDIVWDDAEVDDPVVDEAGLDDAGADEPDVDDSDVDDTESVVNEPSDVSTEVAEGILLVTEICFTDAEFGSEVVCSTGIVDKEGS